MIKLGTPWRQARGTPAAADAPTNEPAVAAPSPELPAPGGAERARPSARERGSVAVMAAAFVIVVALVERIFVRTGVAWGVVGLAGLVCWTLARSATATWAALAGDGTGGSRAREARWYAALCLVPLLRLVSLALPLDGRAPVVRYALVAFPLLLATLLAIRATGFRGRDLGLRPSRSWRWAPLEVVVAASGVAVGYAEYRVLAPAPLIGSLAIGPELAVLVAVLMVAGFAEEILFRGLILRTTADLLGILPAIVLPALLVAALAFEHRSPAAVGVAALGALAFGGAVATTRSLVGVALARGVANVCLLVLFPLR